MWERKHVDTRVTLTLPLNYIVLTFQNLQYLIKLSRKQARISFSPIQIRVRSHQTKALLKYKIII